MKSDESCFTHFNFSFITFPRQVFVNIILCVVIKESVANQHTKTMILHKTKQKSLCVEKNMYICCKM